jgi:hypothetical protein
MSRNCLVLKLVASKVICAEKAVIKSPDAKLTMVMLKWDCKIGPEGNRMLG